MRRAAASRRASSQMLDARGVEYSALDILPDPRIREELSGLSGWPTIPQLFVGGELVGGCDIVTEMFESGELAETLGVEQPSARRPRPPQAPAQAPAAPDGVVAASMATDPAPRAPLHGRAGERRAALGERAARAHPGRASSARRAGVGRGARGARPRRAAPATPAGAWRGRCSACWTRDRAAGARHRVARPAPGTDRLPLDPRRQEVYLCWQLDEDRVAWWHEPEAGFAGPPASMTYLSVGAIFRDEADYLQEWIEFHRLVGVERFFLYDNGSVDDWRTVLAPYMRDGIVDVHDWPRGPGSTTRTTTASAARVEVALDRVHRRRRVPVLAHPGTPVAGDAHALRALAGRRGALVRVRRLRAPPSRRRARDRELPAPHDRAAEEPLDQEHRGPARGRSDCFTSHAFRYRGRRRARVRGGRAPPRTERQADAAWPSQDRTAAGRSTISHDLLRINHYWTKSREEWDRKTARPDAMHGGDRFFARIDWEEMQPPLSQQRDDSITVYAPALRRALAATGSACAT